MFKTDLSLSVVIPSYNEEANMRATVERCLGHLHPFCEKFEILIVDDASTDGSSDLAERLQGEYPSVKVIRNPVNLGAGLSVLIGMRAASGDVVIHNSMDYPFDLVDLDRVIPLFPRYDVVVVARTNRAAHSRYRKVTSWMHYWLVRLLFGIRLSDMNFVQAYKREVLHKLPVKAKSPAFVTPELLIRATRGGYAVTQVRAEFHRRERGQASYGKPRDILWTLADMLSLRLEGV